VIVDRLMNVKRFFYLLKTIFVTEKCCLDALLSLALPVVVPFIKNHDAGIIKHEFHPV
jgi:hypothetical protein